MRTLVSLLTRPSLAFAIVVGATVAAAAAPRIDVWKSPLCGCCGGWIDHVKAAGFDVAVHEVDDVAPIKTANGVGSDLTSCHTALVDGYVVEGHVPAGDIRRLLAERPAVRGLAAPGMPAGAPGMGSGGEPWEVVSFDAAGATRVFARH